MRGSRFLRVFAPFSLFLVACLILPYMYAQETTAGLQGTVKDQSGAVISNATVEVTSPALIGVKKLETDASGYYRFANLPPGVYTLIVSAKGFRTYKQSGIDLSVGRLPTMDVSLPVGGTAETVEVTGAAPLVDVTQSKVAITVPEDILANIPKGRSFQSLITFAPGARQEPLQSRASGANRIGGFQIDGASDGENVYMVNGLDTTDIQNGGVGKNVPMEFIQEVQIKSGGFEAEFGGAMGGVVNVVQKSGSNNWHGSVLAYFRSDALNANDNCTWFTACGARKNPNIAFVAANRVDSPLDYYLQKKDHERIIDPGFEIGGPIKRDKLWLFLSYVPTFDSLSRTVNFTSTDPVTGGPNGVRTFNQTIDTHNALTRLDWAATNKIRLYGAWQYGYERQTGTDLPNPDSVIPGQVNSTAGNQPSQYRPERGSVNPNSVYTFGGDVTLTPKLVVTARYGYWYTDVQSRGVPQGTRYSWQASSKNLVGVPTAYQQSSGFQTLASNAITFFNINTRQGFNSDASYATSKWGTHNLKVGYGFNRLANDVRTGFNGTLVLLFWGQNYDPLDPSACGIAGKPSCTGTYGYYTIRDGVDTIGNVSSFNQTIYAQDSWNLGHGITLNPGVRFDKEHVPGFVANAPAVDFGFTEKVAPRIGGAWDVLRNGKLKLYASYGQFYDIMKYSLPQGSFGGQYWHDCVYTLDDPNPTHIQPAYSGTHFCPPSGTAPGTTTGQFIENVNFRSVILFPQDPGVDPNLKPLKQHENTVGAEWAIKPNLGLEARYTRKRLDYAIEDVGVAVPGNELYYIGNPGYGIVSNLLQRTTYDSSNPFVPAVAYPPQCPDCPLSPKAVRNYDGLEVRLTKRASGRWFGSVSYTYSRLWGNYGGLTSSEISDGGGGRHGPNNSRYFDLPNMAWDSHGHPAMGLLPTDRPHTLKLFSWYSLKWLHQESIFGVTQSAFSGTPVSTCWASISTTSSCEFVEGHGGWVNMSETPGGNIVSSSVTHDRRTDSYIQTDFTLQHNVHVGSNEKMMLKFEANIFNLFNQHAVTALVDAPFAGGSNGVSSGTQTSTPRIGGGTSGPTDWHALTDKGWNYISTANIQTKTLSSMYGVPAFWQPMRTMRLGVRFVF